MTFEHRGVQIFDFLILILALQQSFESFETRVVLVLCFAKLIEFCKANCFCIVVLILFLKLFKLFTNCFFSNSVWLVFWFWFEFVLSFALWAFRCTNFRFSDCLQFCVLQSAFCYNCDVSILFFLVLFWIRFTFCFFRNAVCSLFLFWFLHDF